MTMPLSTKPRVTLLAAAAILSGLTGCSMFREKPIPKLGAEVTPGAATPASSAAKFTIEIQPSKGKPQAVEKQLTDQVHVQTALEQSGALKKWKRVVVKIYRPLPKGGWHKMDLEFDRESHRVPPEFDYAILPGDRIIVIEDTSTVFDDVAERALKPLGINPPKKKDPIAEKYEIRG